MLLLEAASENRQDINMNRIDGSCFQNTKSKNGISKFDDESDRTMRIMTLGRIFMFKLQNSACKGVLGSSEKHKKNILPHKKIAKVAVIGPAADNIGDTMWRVDKDMARWLGYGRKAVDEWYN
jgi:beta-glucosidase